MAEGWRATDPDNPIHPGPPSASPDGAPIEDRPGRTYLLVTAAVGCRLAESAELYREGDDLDVRFVGGREAANCDRPYIGSAQFEVDSDAVEGVRTVRGDPPVAGTGPGTRTAFVQVGTLRHEAWPTGPAELTGAAPQTMYAALRRAGARNLDEARAALLRKPAAGHRAFGFVLAGCQETGSALFLSRTYLTARLTGGGNTVCDAAAYFLVVYEIPARLVPPKVELI